MEDLIAITNEPMTTPVRKKRHPNFVKSNSLGLLVAANSHSYHGPTTLNWEGGWHVCEASCPSTSWMIYSVWKNESFQPEAWWTKLRNNLVNVTNII